MSKTGLNHVSQIYFPSLLLNSKATFFFFLSSILCLLCLILSSHCGWNSLFNLKIWLCNSPIKMAFNSPHFFHDLKVNIADIFSSATSLCKLQFADDTTSLQLWFTDETTLSTTYTACCALSHCLYFHCLEFASPLLYQVISSRSFKVDSSKSLLSSLSYGPLALFGFPGHFFHITYTVYSGHFFHITYHTVFKLAACLLVSHLTQGSLKCLKSLSSCLLKLRWYLANSNQVLGQAHWYEFLNIMQLDMGLEFKPTYSQYRPIYITN